MKKKEQSAPDLSRAETFRLVSADLSLNRPGFTELILRKNTDSGKWYIEFMWPSHVDNKNAKLLHGEKLRRTYNRFRELIGLPTVPTYFVREKAFNGRGAQGEIGIYKVLGVVDMALCDRGYEWYELYPVTVKKLITGSGKADKEQVAKCTIDWYRRLMLHPDFLMPFANDDESDSSAVAIAWLIQQKLVEVPDETDLSE